MSINKNWRKGKISVAKMKYVYSEVYSFVNAMGEEYINKLPKKIYNSIKENRDTSYNPVFRADQELKKGDLSQYAMAIISVFYISYWCNNVEEKNHLKKSFIENSKKKNK